MATNIAPLEQVSQALLSGAGVDEPIPGEEMMRTPGFNPSADGGFLSRMGESLRPAPRRSALESFDDMLPNGRNGFQKAYTPNTGGDEGPLSRVARAMNDGHAAEVAAQAQEASPPSGLPAPTATSPHGGARVGRGYLAEIGDRLGGDRQGAGYGQAMKGILARLSELSRDQEGGAQESPWRQMQRLGLSMMARGGPAGSGITGIGQAGLDIMDRTDKRRAAQRKAESELLGLVYDHLQGERKYRTGRSDERFDRRMQLQKLGKLSEPKTVRGPDGNLRLVRYDDYGGVHPIEKYSPASPLGAPQEVTGPDGKPALVRFDDFGRAVPVEGYGPKGNETDREIREMIARGVPEGWAQDVARGNVSTEIDDFGNIYAINQTTGEARRLQGGMTPLEPDAGEERPDRDGVFGALDRGIGPWSNMRAAVTATVGPFFEGAPYEDTAGARSSIRNFTQIAKQSLVNSERFPVYEQKIVAELLPDPSRFWNDPDAARAQLRELHGFLRNRIDENKRSIASGNVTQKELGDLSNQNESIRRVLGLMGSPQESDGGLPAGVPEGSRKIGTLDGRPVYQTPDGRRLVAE